MSYGIPVRNGVALGVGSTATLGTDHATPPAHGPSLLIETGSYLLQESGDTLLLE